MALTEWEMHHRDRIAWRKAGRIEGWVGCIFEAVDYASSRRDTIVSGGVPGIKTRGKYKGREDWKNVPLKKVVVTSEEYEAEKLNYIQQTGNCPECIGKGKVIQSWCVKEGTKYKVYNVCAGTGKHK